MAYQFINFIQRRFYKTFVLFVGQLTDNDVTAKSGLYIPL